MLKPSRRAALAAVIAVFALGLAACGDDEPQQRAAFIKFLQTRIIDKKGLHIPIMSDEDVKNFGPYAAQYNILNGFHHDMDKSVSQDLTKAMQISQPRSLEELVSRRDMLPVLEGMMARMASDLDKAKAQADAAHAALKQPADLKAVYDVAYDRMVTGPAAVMREIALSAQQGLPVLRELAAYVAEHRSVISYQGGMPVTNNPEVRGKLEVLLRAAVAVGESSEEGKRKLRKMVEGY